MSFYELLAFFTTNPFVYIYIQDIVKLFLSCVFVLCLQHVLFSLITLEKIVILLMLLLQSCHSSFCHSYCPCLYIVQTFLTWHQSASSKFICNIQTNLKRSTVIATFIHHVKMHYDFFYFIYSLIFS